MSIIEDVLLFLVLVLSPSAFGALSGLSYVIIASLCTCIYTALYYMYNTVNTLFPLFSFITVESTFKMASIQLFNSISSCVSLRADFSVSMDCH